MFQNFSLWVRMEAGLMKQRHQVKGSWRRHSLLNFESSGGTSPLAPPSLSPHTCHLHLPPPPLTNSFPLTNHRVAPLQHRHLQSRSLDHLLWASACWWRLGVGTLACRGARRGRCWGREAPVARQMLGVAPPGGVLSECLKSCSSVNVFSKVDSLLCVSRKKNVVSWNASLLMLAQKDSQGIN